MSQPWSRSAPHRRANRAREFRAALWPFFVALVLSFVTGGRLAWAVDRFIVAAVFSVNFVPVVSMLFAEPPGNGLLAPPDFLAPITASVCAEALRENRRTAMVIVWDLPTGSGCGAPRRRGVAAKWSVAQLGRRLARRRTPSAARQVLVPRIPGATAA